MWSLWIVERLWRWKVRRCAAAERKRHRLKAFLVWRVCGSSHRSRFPEVPIGKCREIRFMHVTHQSACVSRNLGGTTENFRPMNVIFMGFFYSLKLSHWLRKVKIFTTYYADVLAMRKVFDSKVVKYLEKLSAAEVLELDCVHDFFGEICQWVHMASYQTPCMLLLSPFYSCINLAF